MSRSQALKEINKIIIKKHEEDLKELRREASKYLEDHPDCTGLITDMSNRSCWYCNPGHKHLRKAEFPFVYLECGNTYYKGIDITEET